MATNWQQVVNEIKTYRTYYNSLPDSAEAIKAKAFFISRDELLDLLRQKDPENLLDGIRIYFGAVMNEGQMVPTLHITACEWDAAAKKMNDFNLGSGLPSGTAIPRTGNKQPCPTFCSKTNILNQ